MLVQFQGSSDGVVGLRDLQNNVSLNGAQNYGGCDDGLWRRVLGILIYVAGQSVCLIVLRTWSMGDGKGKSRKD